MKKYYYFLVENPKYPEEIYAKSKEEVKSLILESLGKDREDQILNIFSEEEFNKLSGKTGALYKDPDDFKSGKDFLQNVIKSSMEKMKEDEQATNNITNNIMNENIQQNIKQNIKPINEEIKYFESGTEHFKVERGIVYKKVWRQVKETNNFRIVSLTNKKPIKNEKYYVEELVWEPIA